MKTKKLPTAEELMKAFANKHSYETWDEMMYDTHGHIQIEYTAKVMKQYAKLHREAILKKVEASSNWC